MKEHSIKINPSICIGCALCVKDCPANNLIVAENKAVLQSQSCIKCGHCVAICPKAAVSMTGFDELPIPLDVTPRVDPVQLINSFRARRSIRQFQDKPITEEFLYDILEAGRWTPTAKNAPSVSYLVLQKEKSRAEEFAVAFFKKLMPIAGLFYPSAKGIKVDDSFFFKGAPTVIVVISKDKVSGSLAAANMALMAESHGLGVLYSGFFAIAANMSSRLRKVLGLMHKDKVVTTLVLGYSAVNYHRTTQKDKAVITHM